MNSYILPTLKSKTRCISIYVVPKMGEVGYKLSIVHVDNTYMVKEISTNVH